MLLAKRQTKDTVARTEAAVTHLKVQAAQQRGERIGEVAFDNFERLALGWREWWRLLDQARGKYLQILR